MSTSVKYIHQGMRGAPVVTGSAGPVLSVLAALLESGWGTTTALAVNVASGIATATLTPGETFDAHSVILVAGATPGALNGEARVLTSSSTSVTWATTAPDGPATGTITIKNAPQTTWAKPFAATNKAAYRSTHVQSAGHYLRVDDTGATFARLRGYESMSDVDTGIGPFPTDAQMSGGGYLWKAASAGATPMRYRVFCDERTILIALAAGIAPTFIAAPLRGFGDTIPLAPGGDAWSTMLSFNGNSHGQSANGALDAQFPSAASGGVCMPRTFAALGGSVLVNTQAFTGSANSSSGADTWLGALPSAVDGQVKPSRVFLREQAVGSPPRAIVPGVYYLPQSGALSVLNDGDILTGSGDLAGRKLMVVATGSAFTASPTGAYLVDITGPWR